MFKRFVSCVSVLLLSSALCFGQDANPDDIEDTEGSSGPRRKITQEFGIGASLLSVSADAANFPSESKTGLAVSYGVQIPLYSISKNATIWLVPTALLQTTVVSTQLNLSDGQMDYTFGVPVHLTFGIGALRRKSDAWGFQVGIGAHPFLTTIGTSFRVTPSVMADVSYAPKAVYRLRFRSDIFSSPDEKSLSIPVTLQTTSIQFIFAF